MLVGLDKYYKMFENGLSELKTNLIFKGMNGIGKYSFALELVKKEVQNETNIHIVKCEKDKQNISIEQIRNLFIEINNKPIGDAKHYVIIDDAEKLNDVSANALLKRLEEPNETEMFILILNEQGAMLDTIISRCFVINFECDYNSVDFKPQNEKEQVIFKILRQHGMGVLQAYIQAYINDDKIKSRYNDAYKLAYDIVNLTDIKKSHTYSDKVFKSESQQLIIELIKELNTKADLTHTLNNYYSNNVNKLIVIDILISQLVRANNQ